MSDARSDTIPITRPALDADDFAAVEQVLRSGHLVQGEQVRLFEEELAVLTGASHAVVVSNCTAALHIALLAMGVGPGDMVIVTPYSWVATANVIELCGATPIFSDIDLATMNLSADALEAKLEDLGRSGLRDRVKAVMPVHTFGNTAGYESIQKIADAAGLPIVEDAACALGATVGERSAGTLGRAGAYSFHPRKIITTGEGGALVTDDEELAEFARSFRNHGQAWTGSRVAVVRPGGNLRLTDFQAALGRCQLKKLTALCDARSELADRYDRALLSMGFHPQVRSSGAVVQSYVALTPEGIRADATVDALRSQGVEATIGTNAIPYLDYYQRVYRATAEDFPVTSAVAERAVTLPLFPGMSDAEFDAVIRALESSVG